MTENEKPDVALDPNDPFVKELEDYLEMPYKSREQEEVERSKQEQQYNRLMADFDQTEIGKKLHKRRSERFGQKAYERLAREFQSGLSPWGQTVIGFASDLMFEQDKEYQILTSKYMALLNAYVEKHTA